MTPEHAYEHKKPHAAPVGDVETAQTARSGADPAQAGSKRAHDPPAESPAELLTGLPTEMRTGVIAAGAADGAGSGYATAELTDVYQVTMAYAYWMAGRHDEHAAFELFFRAAPFGGEFAVCAGVGEAVRLVQRFAFNATAVEHARALLPHADPAFFRYLAQLDACAVRVRAVHEGAVVFARAPLLAVDGPLAVCQLLETPLLNLVGFASLVATNAARMRLAAGPRAHLLEFGVRRAQGPDGAVSAARYAALGGFDATSNVLAARLFSIPARGTHAHSFVQAYSGLEQLARTTLHAADGEEREFVQPVLSWRARLPCAAAANMSELAAFIAYAQAFPHAFVALVDSYDTLRSGVPNFICVALALVQFGYRPVGIRLDSGDLAFLSKATHAMFVRVAAETGVTELEQCTIIASNDLSESVLRSLQEQGHAIDTFGIGTNLVTCSDQPALGCVYKLVEAGGEPRIKLSQAKGKMTIPGEKRLFRIYGKEGKALCDVMTRTGDPPPEIGKRFLMQHPYDDTKRAYVSPTRVEELLLLVWQDGKIVAEERSLMEIRAELCDVLQTFRPDILRKLNPTPYKVSVSKELFDQMWELYHREVPVGVLE